MSNTIGQVSPLLAVPTLDWRPVSEATDTTVAAPSPGLAHYCNQALDDILALRYAPGRDKQKYHDCFQCLRDAGNDPATVQTQDQLRTEIGAAAFEDARPLLAHLDVNPTTLTYLKKIHAAHGGEVFRSVCQRLVRFAGECRDGELRRNVLHDALHDLAIPSDIDQKNKGTCGPAAVQGLLAISSPTRYVDMLTSLAMGRTWNGIRPDANWRADREDQRSTSCRIMQNAMYRHIGDTTDDGMLGFAVTTLVETVMGDDEYDLDYYPVNGSAGMAQYLEDDLARGRPVVAGFNGHWVLVVGLDRTSTPPRVILNSWGEQHTMTLEEFRSHVWAVVNYDDDGSDNRRVRGRVSLGD